MSTPAAATGSRYSCAAARTASLIVSPRSTNSTNRGQAWVTSETCGAAANASSYAIEVFVTGVQITPTRWLRVAAMARRTAGRITSTTGTG